MRMTQDPFYLASLRPHAARRPVEEEPVQDAGKAEPRAVRRDRRSEGTQKSSVAKA